MVFRRVKPNDECSRVLLADSPTEMQAQGVRGLLANCRTMPFFKPTLSRRLKQNSKDRSVVYISLTQATLFSVGLGPGMNDTPILIPSLVA